MLISNHNSWRNATDAQRNDEVQHLLSQGLSTRFDFIDIKQFECAGLSNPIARFKHRQTGMVMHLIPGSDDFKLGISPEFYATAKQNQWMDIDENDFEQKFPHSVPPFLIGEFVITEAQWKAMDGNKLFKEYGEDHGVDAVKREDVREVAKRVGLRLPSEIEWEYACKAGTNTLFYWGNEPDDDYAWTSNTVTFPAEGYFTIARQHQKKPNAFGLVAMLGNQNEWVEDDKHLYGVRQSSNAPYYSANADSDGILRGGWICYDWDLCRSTTRIACGAADGGCSARLAVGLSECVSD
ncbi:formylglycine-generating enzyme family protein [Alteromonas sp. ASW11-130]|uniref:formylglycine-generating enzyme family protein n=1 Tax=Alteromonas sp. ASW11-130 TaxID=3015775 RepID=UPI0022429F3D|nr:SUMF1/EgtB/PvdO family nonheme iron enzyme [Alteromonas sp. ASW11-130]MCW8091747.1 formylglycine-generating enzyme family protein [Alteromonas sp. ASW11-130]